MTNYKCYGAILGDLVGAPYEMAPIKTKTFDFMNKANHITDDTIMTLATASKLLNDSDYTLEYKWWGNKYYGDYYGKNFKEWIKREDWTSNDSFGNGAAMRVSPIGYKCKTLDEVRHEAWLSCRSSHDNVQAYKGSYFMAAAIHMLSRPDDYPLTDIAKLGYDLYGDMFKPEVFKPFEKFKVSCDYTVPVAFRCFTNASSLEDCIRNAVFLGGDCDTIGSMAAELWVAKYGMDIGWVDYVEMHLDEFQLYTLEQFNKMYGS